MYVVGETESLLQRLHIRMRTLARPYELKQRWIHQSVLGFIFFVVLNNAGKSGALITKMI